MKTIEEKAKAYDSIIEKANKMHSENCEACRACIEELIPELAESEDEKIRKGIFKALSKKDARDVLISQGIEVSDALAWLEKQGQLYIRFGDIPSNEKSKIYRGEEEIGDENGVSVYPAFELNGNIVLGLTLPITRTTLYTQQHLLEYDNRPCYLVSGDYIGKDIDGQPLINNVSIIKKIDSYRVKEENQNGQEKDILEDAILDGNEDGLIAETIRYKKEKQGEKKPADSYCQENCKGFQETGKCFADGECKAKKEAEQKSVTWNEEDEDHVNSLLKRLKGLCRKEFTTTRFAVNEDENWLKSLKGRVPSKQEWSEEDEKMFDYALDMVEWYSGKNEDKSRLVSNWLKSLRPQNRWKPSDEQMEALDWQIENTSVGSWQYKATKELLADLKKLKEE